ncbi:unnamed protein product [Cylindrotheca closterium]|uniref:Uncharacterized protein n=1 Tax=Cylindrotheca closterium TaxID=2856 RepID=A0AAD2FMF0_9STRA|nr:unnamed protein product [Cylindrotheca closterium]CAJ1945626.1 unnamed protein product [Cylindrotheca closterium]
MDGFQVLPPNRLVHVTRFGLGHRLIRATSAYHLAKILALPRLKNQWGSCSKDTNWRGKDGNDAYSIFPYLFGNDVWILPTESSIKRQGKRVIVRNDVYGYIPGQIYKNFELPIDKSNEISGNGPLVLKLMSDSEFYSQLVDNYRFQAEVLEFMEKHKFREHEVVGLHIRAGNGEKTHFEWSGRGITDEEAFISDSIHLVEALVEKLRSLQRKKPLVFLATDTQRLIPVIQNAMKNIGVETVHLEQIRVEDNGGVTFQAFASKEDDCLKGWQAMFSDMLLLGNADVVVAARHSSFTQSLPLSRVFDRHRGEEGPHFCEVSSDATTMTCFEDKKTWLFRQDENKIFQIENGNQTKSFPQVTHRVLVSFPDVETPNEMDTVIEFLQKPRIGNDTDILMHTYGKKGFNPKYRGQKSEKSMWTFAYS